MHLSSLLVFSELLTLGLAFLQRPLTALKDQSQTPLDDVFSKKVEWALEHFQIPGVGVAVVRDDEVFAKGYGLSDIETSKPVTEHTLFFAGSTSKAMTAAAVSLLIDDNVNYPEIQWDTPVHSLLPADFSLSDTWATTHITIIDILSHHSGLPRHDWVWLANLTVQETVQSMKYLPLTASPRTQWQYCNLMYVAAAHLIEIKTNQSLHSFMAQKLWGPLNMSETYLSLSDAQDAHKDISQGHYIDFDGKIASTNRAYIESIRGAGNVLSSVSDYAKWISAILNHRQPISEQSYATLLGAHSIMLANPSAPFQSPDLYGLGWILQTYGGHMLVRHDGAQFGYGAFLVLVPSRKFGLVIFGNNMIGTVAASEALAFHLIDEEFGIPAEGRFDWVSKYASLSNPSRSIPYADAITIGHMLNMIYRGNAVINATRPSDNIISQLYPTIPQPPLPNPVDLSAYEGMYSHPAYPDFNISSNCPKSRAPIPRGLNQTIPDLCASFVKPNEYSENETLDLYHVTGTFWVQIAAIWNFTSATRAEFRLSSDGSVSLMGIEAEPSMAIKGEKIWWKRSA